MPTARIPAVIRHAALGAVTGLLILGLGGRVAMVASSLVFGLPVGLTLRGTLAVVVTGGIYGAVGGALHYWSRRRLPRQRWITGAALGTTLFIIIGAASTANRQTAVAWQYPAQTVALFLPVAWAWGLTMAHLVPNPSPVPEQVTGRPPR